MKTKSIIRKFKKIGIEFNEIKTYFGKTEYTAINGAYSVGFTDCGGEVVHIWTRKGSNSKDFPRTIRLALEVMQREAS